MVTAVMCKKRAGCVQHVELFAAHAMAVRILDRLCPPCPRIDLVDDANVDIDANVAVFIAFKTECVYSPMNHRTLVRLTGLCWAHLQAREVEILRSIDWKLYDGALT